MKESIVVSLRISPELKESLERIADSYRITLSHLLSSVLTSFVLEYSNNLVERFSPDENSKNIE